jgi:hypothetical protein
MKEYLLRLACWFYTWRYNMKNARKGISLDWRIIYSISAHETGNFTSSLYKRTNNCFGMRVPKMRPWFGIGSDNNYSVYSSVWMSVKDYFAWVDYVGITLPESDLFLSVLENWVYQMKTKNYFEASLNGYVSGVKSAYSKYQNLKSPVFFLVYSVTPTIILIIWNRKKIFSYLRKLVK